MIFLLLAHWINILTNLVVLLVIVQVALSYFLSPYNPFRHALDRIVEPMLAPIRRVVPLIGMFDLSPLVLIILIEVVSYALINFLSSLAR
ncbi:MAG: YggT family protein [Anaerolineales bacterium]|jgi:YggT family protein